MFAVKVEITDPQAEVFSFARQKTMYGGKHIAPGDTLFIFDSENAGGSGLMARGLVTAAREVARVPGVLRQTPRVDVTATRIALARRRLGRAELKSQTAWDDGEPAAELNFKLYRQATDKIVGLTPAAAEFLLGFF